MPTIFIHQWKSEFSCSHTVFAYDKPLINQHASADLCAVSLEYYINTCILLKNISITSKSDNEMRC